MQGFRRFMKRLFSLRNLVPIIVILGAAVGSLGLSPFGIQFTTEQITLALLGFLAVDALVERLDLLINIEQGIHAIQRKLTPQAVASAFFRRRRDFPRMEQLINEARDDIWVAGVSLDTMVTLTKSFESKMREGCNIRFMAHAPRGNAAQPIADYYGTNPDFMSTRIKSNLSAIASRLRPTNGASIEIRTLDRVLPTGYFIIDPTSSKGRMIVQLYLYHTDPGEAPLFEISREVDELWFSTYLNQFKKAWDDATIFELSYPKPQ